MSKVIGKYPQLFEFILNNKQKVIDHLSKSKTLYNTRYEILYVTHNGTLGGEQIVSEIRDQVFALWVISIDFEDYQKLINKKFPHSYQTLGGISSDGILRTSEYDILSNKDVIEYILEFWIQETRANKLDEILN